MCMVSDDYVTLLGEPRLLVRIVRYSERRWRRRDGSLVPVEDVRAWVDGALARVPGAMRGAAL